MDLVVFGKTRLVTLVAVSEFEQARGLMFRPWPPPVMSFPYDNAEKRTFWMKNTPSPLDIVFCRANKVVAVVRGEPFAEAHVGADEPADLVVELPRGSAQKLGIERGSCVQLILSLQTLAKKYELILAKVGSKNQ